MTMKFGQTAPSRDTSAQLYPFYKIARKGGSNFWNFYVANSREAQNEGVFENT